MIEIKGVTKVLGNKKVLDTINLTIENGKVFGLVGVNGEGVLAQTQPYKK